MKNGRLYDLTGSPGFASPGFDLIRSGKRERAAQFGLADENEESFECNQSFPKVFSNHNKLKHNNFSPDLNRIKGCDLNSVSFLKKNLIKNLNSGTNRKDQNSLFNETLANSNYMNNSYLSTTIDKSWILYNQFINSNNLMTNNQAVSQNYDEILTVNNPNKALMVINGRTTEILTANNISCDLFGYNENKLIGMKLKDLLDLSDQSSDGKKQEIIMESDRLDQNGKVVLCSGKIFDAITNDKFGNKNNEYSETFDEKAQNKNTAKISISMFMQKLTDEQEPKCLCVMEPIQRVTGTFGINVKGRIKYYNPNFSYIFGYTNMQQLNVANEPSSLSAISASSVLNGKDITELIPSMKLPMSGILPELRKQLLTGRSLQGENIPLTVNILNKQLFNNEEIVYNCNVNVYTNISGLVTIRPTDFKINSYNSTFSRFIFGYDEKELLEKPITYLIPNFFDPDTTSTATGKMTPLAVNNSYINVPLSSSKQINSKINLNNGSFLETRHTPQKQQLDKSKSSGIPTFVITEVENKLNRSNSTLDNEEPELYEAKNKNCALCHNKLSKRNSTSKDLLVEFNLETEEYSPNKKCASYVDNIVFSPTSSPYQKSSASLTNTPQSSVKKTLLAKAITNNANFISEKSNMSLDEVSTCSSTASYMDELSSPVGSPCKGTSQDQSYSNLDLSELESLNDNEELKSNQDLCDKCKLEQKLEMEKNKQNADNSDVSLIAIDNDNECLNDIEENEVNSSKNKNKRKASLIQIDSEQNFDLSDRRRSSILSDLNTINNNVSQNNDSSSQNDKNKKFKNQVTSTPAAISNINMNSNTASKLKSMEHKFSNKMYMSTSSNFMNANDGIFFGRGKHSDGSFIRIFYQRKLVNLANEKNANEEYDDDSGQNLICVWISRDPYSDKSIIDFSCDQSQLFRTFHNQTINDGSNYLNEYEDIRTLGRGASGFVQLARRKIDRFEVVTKYILKSKIYKENWINDEKYGNIPLEISILCKLDHSNLIKVLEVFQDPEHVQMVMEKHGCGMDLFEFIDRQIRHIDERLASYIFKQIVSAVSYLHSNNIVHRDIKDENIVINEKFHIKLIDFGSAAYVTKGKKFATFCGTMDYCSPDVLLGNKYYGPELDVWTCGIALYTLIFCENPFQSAEETIECILKPPFKVSKELMKLLFSVLCPKPELRATIEEIETNEWVNQQVDITQFKWENVVRNTEFHSNNAGDFNREEDINTNIITKPCDQLVEKQINELDLNHENEENIAITNSNNTNNKILNDNNNQNINKQFIINNLLSKSF